MKGAESLFRLNFWNKRVILYITRCQELHENKCCLIVEGVIILEADLPLKCSRQTVCICICGNK